MITITLTIWTPLIVVFILCFLSFLVNGFEFEPTNNLGYFFEIITSVVIIMAFWFYIAYGIWFLLTKVNFVIA